MYEKKIYHGLSNEHWVGVFTGRSLKLVKLLGFFSVTDDTPNALPSQTMIVTLCM